jgi:hypothetical protein
MFKKSLVLAAAMIAGSSCIANAVPTKFLEFEVFCSSGMNCSKDIPPPMGTQGTYSLKGLSCTWISENVTRVDIGIVKKSNRAQQFVIPIILTAEERAAKIVHVHGFEITQYFIYTSQQNMMVTFQSSADGQMAATCYAAF